MQIVRECQTQSTKHSDHSTQREHSERDSFRRGVAIGVGRLTVDPRAFASFSTFTFTIAPNRPNAYYREPDGV